MHYFGIIGYGGMGSWHHRRALKPDNIQYKAAYDIRPERLEKAAEHGLIACKSLEQLLADRDIDTVLIATSNDSHKDLAIRAMDAGKNVICEKPAAMNSCELQEMLEAAERNHVLFTTHQNRRMDEGYQIIKDLYEKNTLGPVFRIETHVHGSRGIADTWRRKKALGGGMLYDWGIHLIDQMLYLVDSPVTSVYAEFQYISQQEVDDNVRLTLTFQNGLSALLEIGTCNYIPLPLWYMAGTTGTAQIDFWDLQGRMQLLTNAEIQFEDEIPKTVVGPSITMAPRSSDTMATVALPAVTVDKGLFYRNFLDALDHGAPLWITPQEIMRDMQIIDLAFQSGSKKQVIFCNI